jgi:hypothetical protein
MWVRGVKRCGDSAIHDAADKARKGIGEAALFYQSWPPYHLIDEVFPAAGLIVGCPQ